MTWRSIFPILCSTPQLMILVLLCCVEHGYAQPAHERTPITFPLVSNRQSTVSVVVGGNDPVLSAAVRDFADYVQRITGAKLNIVQSTHDLTGPTLHVGETEYHEQTENDRKAIILDGFLIARVGGDDLIITGNLPAGTANGLYSVLQEQFGVRWYYPGPLWEIVPERASIAIHATPDPRLSAYVENPSFQGRRVSTPAEFGRRMRLTQKGVALPYVGSGHALNHVVSVSQYARQHPDYFPLVDGRRILENEPNPCFTHPDMPEVFMRYVREGGRAFGVNDNLSACRCERCMAVDGKSRPYRGMWNCSESFFQLISKVSAQTEKEFPGKRLGMFAYQLTNSPPQTVQHIGSNVDIVLCQDTSQYFDPEYRRLDQEMTAEWTKKAGGVSFYDYVGISYWTPRCFPHILADQLKHLARSGVKGYYTHATTMPDSSMPMFYLLYQMLWNANCDPDRVIDTMIRDLYAESAEPIRRFYDHWEQCWRRPRDVRWLFGMDNLRGEMQIYSLADIEEGKRYLDEASRMARDEKVRQRIAFLQRCFGFTLDTARVYDISTRALRFEASDDPAAARSMSAQVVQAWKDFAQSLSSVSKLSGSPLSGFPRTGRVRLWGLRQQVRDAAVAPLVRWACANEGKMSPQELRATERSFAMEADSARALIGSLMLEDTGFTSRPAEANPLRVADVSRLNHSKQTDPQNADSALRDDGAKKWAGVGVIDALPWVFRARPPQQNLGRYDEPAPENIAPQPDPDDLSIRWQAAWDDQRLYLHIIVTDDLHAQDQPSVDMWKQDSVQIAMTSQRCNFEYNLASWDYIFGNYREDVIVFGVSLHDGATDVLLSRGPARLNPENATRLIAAKARRADSRTTYDLAVDWNLLAGFEPRAEKSLGVCLVVNDVDRGEKRSAEYGAGATQAKRPTEFAALRLAE